MDFLQELLEDIDVLLTKIRIREFSGDFDLFEVQYHVEIANDLVNELLEVEAEEE